MSKVYFISDYHFGHAKVIEFEDRLRARILGVDNIDEHDSVLIGRTLNTVNKRDTLWVLGDNGNVSTILAMFEACKSKHINYVPGNHDSKTHIAQLAALDKVKVSGLTKYKQYWVSHAPVHPQELRGKGNIHGHCHSKVMRDPRYKCMSVENTEGYPIWGQDIIEGNYCTDRNFPEVSAR